MPEWEGSWIRTPRWSVCTSQKALRIPPSRYAHSPPPLRSSERGTSSNSSLLPLSRMSKSVSVRVAVKRTPADSERSAWSAADNAPRAAVRPSPLRAGRPTLRRSATAERALPQLGPESARREVDALELERVEAAERDGAVGVEAEGGEDRGAVEEDPRLGDIAAAHEEPGPLAHALKPRKRLDRAEGIGRGARRGHDVEIRQRHVGQGAETERADFDRDRLQAEGGGLHHDREGPLEGEVEGVPDLEIAGPLDDQRPDPGGGGVEAEVPRRPGERALQRLEQERVGSGERGPRGVAYDSGDGPGRRLRGQRCRPETSGECECEERPWSQDRASGGPRPDAATGAAETDHDPIPPGSGRPRAARCAAAAPRGPGRLETPAVRRR